MQAQLTNKNPRIFAASIVLAYLEKCGFIAQIAICGHMELHCCQSQRCLLKVATVMKMEYFI
jgi:hypothetical protein